MPSLVLTIDEVGILLCNKSVSVSRAPGRIQALQVFPVVTSSVLTPLTFSEFRKLRWVLDYRRSFWSVSATGLYLMRRILYISAGKAPPSYW